MTRKHRTALSLAGINSGVVASVVLLGPFGALALFVSAALAVYVFMSEIGFTFLVTAISHVNDDFGSDFDVIRALKWAAVGSSMIITVWQFAFRRVWENVKIGFIEKYFAVFVVWGIVCLPFSDSVMISIQEFLRLLSYYLIYIVTRLTVRTRKQFYVILGLFAVIVFASSAYSLGSVLQGGYFRVRGFMNNAGAFAQILAYMIPFLIAAAIVARKSMLRYSLFLTSALGALALMLAWSRASIIAGFVQYVVFLYMENKKRLLAYTMITLVVVGASVLAIPSVWSLFYTVGRLQAGSTHRFLLWQRGIEAAAKSPIVGHGFAVPTYEVLDRVAWNDASEAELFHKTSVVYNVHNQFIHSALTTGIPGLFIFIGFLYFLIKNGIRDCRSEKEQRRRVFFSAMLSINVSLVIVCTFANAPHLTVGSMANYFWIALGLTHAIRDHQIEV